MFPANDHTEEMLQVTSEPRILLFNAVYVGVYGIIKSNSKILGKLLTLQKLQLKNGHFMIKRGL